MKDLRAVVKGIVEATEKRLAPDDRPSRSARRRCACTVVSEARRPGRHEIIGGPPGCILAKHVAPAFDRMAADVDKRNAAGMRLLGIQPGSSGLSPGSSPRRETRTSSWSRKAGARSTPAASREGLRRPRQPGPSRPEELQDLLEERGEGLRVGRRGRIARDQTLKTNAAFTRRSGTCGRGSLPVHVENPTSKGRARPPFARRAPRGEQFSLRRPPEVDGEPANPGEPILCRVRAPARPRPGRRRRRTARPCMRSTSAAEPPRSHHGLHRADHPARACPPRE